MPKRNTGLVVGKEFRPPEGAQPLDWCYLTVDLSDDERISVRIRRDQVPRADVGDIVVFRRPRSLSHAVPKVTRLGSDPSLLPPVEGATPRD
ncbi:MAG TPA: hypothetical protein VJ948_02720 [Acidimicrobiia bacterium]|nr:hypothetical protein [Acidimicrobiia bacterium]